MTSEHASNDRAGQPERADLSYLYSDRPRPGATGIFAGDWAWISTPRGPRIPVGFIGTYLDDWNGWAVFSCDRQVAEAIVAEQQRARSAERGQLAASILDEEELQGRLDEAYPPMYFDGNAIVVDERRTYGPGGMSRITPDENGRYVVKGWSWTWTAVRPGDCDRIVGTIPPFGQHQEFVEFIHSPVRAPHGRLAVTAMKDLETSRGVAYTAQLALDGNLVGTIENGGHGGMTEFHPHGGTFTRRDMEAFADGCRWLGQPTTEEEILEALIDEYTFSQMATEASATACFLVRLLDEDHHTLTILALPNPQPHGHTQREAVGTYLTTTEGRPFPNLTEFRWQFWARDQWMPLSTVRANGADHGHGDDSSAPGGEENLDG